MSNAGVPQPGPLGEPVIRLFGPVSVEADSHQVGLGGGRQRAVLGYLALNVGRPVSVDGLVGAIWGEDPPVTVANTVQVYVSALRRALRGVGIDIERSGATYRLLAGPDDVDASLFQRLSAAGRAALRAGEPGRGVEELLRKALELRIAEPFAGLSEHPFVPAAAADLERIRLGAMLDMGAALCAVGRPDEAVTEAARLRVDHPYDEACWELSITALYYAGRQPEALATYRRVRDLLADDLGIDPSERLVALQAAVLTHTLPAVVASERIAEAAAADDGPFASAVDLVGREALVSRLVMLLEAARLVTLTGLGGIGKTALAVTAGRELLGSGSSVVFADLSAVVSAGQAAATIGAALGLDSAQDADADPVAALSGCRRQAVVVVDNAEQVVGLGVMLAGVLRSTPGLTLLVTSRVPLRIRSEHVIAVPPLGIPDAVALFRRRAAEVRPDLDLAEDLDVVAELCAMAGELPLAVEIVASRLRAVTVRELADQLHRRAGGVLDLPGAVDLPQRQASVRAVIGWAVERLSAVGVLALGRLAPVAGWMSSPMARRLAGGAHGTTGDIDDAIEELAAAALVDVHDSAGRLRVPVPVAELARILADPETLLANERRVVDAVIATAAEAEGVDLLRAGGAVVDSALRLALELGEPTRATTLLSALLRYSLVANRTAEVLHYADLVRAMDSPTDVAAAGMIAAGSLAARLGRPDASELLEHGLAAASQSADRALVVNGWCYLGSVYCMRGAVGDGRRCADNAKLAAGDDPPMAALARDFSALVATYEGDHERAVDLNLLALAEARRIGDLFASVDLLQRTAESLLELGRNSEADQFLDEAFRLSRSTPIGPLASRLVAMRSVADIALARPAAALGHATEVLRMTRSGQPDPLFAALALRVLASAQAQVGAVASAGRLDGAATALFADAGIPDEEMWVAPIRTVLFAARESAEHRAQAVLGGAVPGPGCGRVAG